MNIFAENKKKIKELLREVEKCEIVFISFLHASFALNEPKMTTKDVERL